LVFGLGAFGSAMGRRFASRAMTVGAVLVVVLGLSMLSQGWSLYGAAGAPTPGTTIADGAAPDETPDAAQDGVQVKNSTLNARRYPAITVTVGTPVRWIIDAPKGSITGCNNRIFIGEYGIEYAFKEGENIIEFTPERVGRFRYSCWMGMLSGTITVVEA
jgi:hypothetical protein